MSDYAKIALIVLTPYLVFGVLLFFTRRNPRLQFFILWPVILAVWIWLGFRHGWQTFDFVQLGIMLFLCVIGGIGIFLKAAKK